MNLKEKIRNLRILKSKKGYVQLLLPLLLNVWVWLGVAIFVLIVLFSSIFFMDKLLGAAVIVIGLMMLYRGYTNPYVLGVMAILALVLLFKGEWVGLDITAGQALSMVRGG